MLTIQELFREYENNSDCTRHKSGYAGEGTYAETEIFV